MLGALDQNAARHLVKMAQALARQPGLQRLEQRQEFGGAHRQAAGAQIIEERDKHQYCPRSSSRLSSTPRNGISRASVSAEMPAAISAPIQSTSSLVDGFLRTAGLLRRA